MSEKKIPTSAIGPAKNSNMTEGCSLMGHESFFRDTRVAVTGAAGTVGGALAERLLHFPIGEVRAIDSDESALFSLGEKYRTDPRLQSYLCNIRDVQQLIRVFEGIDYVVHAAALKHVPLCERSPSEAVQTNIVGVQNVVAAAKQCRVRKMLFTSSDKAVNPTNVMGTSKLMGERLVTAANAISYGHERTVFASTRFGNVAGSQGSVVPHFCDQILSGASVTLTDSEMTRFVMTIDEAVEMLLSTLQLAIGGEVFVAKMPVVNIETLAHALVDLVAPICGRAARDVGIEIIGIRPGEKLFEELTSSEEVRRTIELDDLFVVLPAIRNIYANIGYEYPGNAAKPADRVYVSSQENPMNASDLQRFLLQNGVLPDELRQRIDPGTGDGLQLAGGGIL